MSECKIIHTYPTNTLGWECDTEGYVVKSKKDGVYINETSHGFTFSLKSKDALEALKKWRTQYQDHLDKINEAIKLIDGD